MKKLSFLLSLFLISLVFHSCLKDVKLRKYTYYLPEYSLKSEVRAAIKSSAAQDISLPGRIYVQGNYIYVNETGKGIHVIDYSNPSSPQNVSYIPIPGNMNLAVEGNYLYADEDADLLTLDISNPLDIKLVNIAESAFYNYYGSDSSHILTGWRRVDTMVKNNDPVFYHPSPEWYTFNDLAFASQSNSSGGKSIGGSMAQFTVLNDRLYTVSTSNLNVFNVENKSHPSFVKTVATQNYIETIYPFENNLFLGGSSGMYIYDASDADNPAVTGTFGHVRTCDPVIAEPGKAYVTLRNGNACGGYTNELDVLNTDNLTNPVLIRSYQLTNPRGLAKEGDNLFICDGTDGLKIFDAADANNITQTKVVSGFEANDVIVSNGIAIITAADGLYLVDCRNTSSASVMSKINIQN